MHFILSDDPICHLAFYTCVPLLFDVYYPFYRALHVVNKLSVRSEQMFFHRSHRVICVYECVCMCGEGVCFAVSTEKSCKKMIIVTKWSPALGMYKGRSFEEQNGTMERCSILLNPTDFCLVIFFGRFPAHMADQEAFVLKGRSIFHSLLPLWEARVIASDDAPPLLPGNV